MSKALSIARLRSVGFFLNQRGVQPSRSDPSITECGFEAWMGLSVRSDQVNDIGLRYYQRSHGLSTFYATWFGCCVRRVGAGVYGFQFGVN